MDAATIQGKIYYGYKQAAIRLGQAHDQFRPAPGALPIDLTNQIGSILAVMSVATAANFNFVRPALDTNYLFAVLADGTQLQVGDVLKSPIGLYYFIGAMAPLMPIVAIRCNAIITLNKREGVKLLGGANPYGGPIQASETPTLMGTPACILLTAAGRSSKGNALPTDAPGPIKYDVYLPPGVDLSMISVDDVIVDGAGRRLVVTALEPTPVALRVDTVHQLS